MIRCFIILFFLAFLPACSHFPKNLSSFENLTWVEFEGGPILSPGNADSWTAMRADTGNSIVSFRRHWWIYHSGQNSKGEHLIGAHISSGNSMTGPWSDVPENPLLKAGEKGSWEAEGVAHPSVIKWERGVWMYFSGTDGALWQIGMAKSADGIHFARYPGNPVLPPSPRGAWDGGGVTHPSVIHDGYQFVMAYRGWASDVDDTHAQIGIATSRDGRAWEKHPGNPVLGFGPPGAWDEWGLLAPRLWYENGVYFLNYSGKPNDAAKLSSIGHATATSLGTWVKSRRNPVLFAGNTQWKEIEWGTAIRMKRTWYMLTTAYFDMGKTILWIGN